MDGQSDSQGNKMSDKPEYLFRLARDEDLQPILKMAKKFYKMHPYYERYPLDIDSTTLHALNMMDNGLLIVAIIGGTLVNEGSKDQDVVGGEVVGMLGFTYFQLPINIHVKIAEEQMFWIEEDHRGKGGLARLMMLVANTGLKADDCVEVVMSELSSSSEHVATLYASLGLEKIEGRYSRVL